MVSVGVAELKVSDNSLVLASFGLGSCVAVTMFDSLKRIGGLAHVMLPESRGKESESAPGKFADVAVERLLAEMMSLGARSNGVRCKIVGGAQMFEVPGSHKLDKFAKPPESASHIGARNVGAVKSELARLKIPLVGEDTGGNYGRTVRFNTSNGEVEVTSIYHGRTVL
ncbi:MAG: chemotaxis protein CheD [Actinomycetota bacterium]